MNDEALDLLDEDSEVPLAELDVHSRTSSARARSETFQISYGRGLQDR